MIRVVLPTHLRVLAKVKSELILDLDGEVSLRDVLDTIEVKYPVLRGTIRDQQTGRRRAMVRFFACEQDYSNCDPHNPLPAEVVRGQAALFIVGAIAGG